MKLYKGFTKDMTCRDFQFEEGKTYTHDGEPELCKEGFHACEVPLDCLRYYRPSDGSIYREVEMDGVTNEREDDSKRVGKTIKIGARISIRDIVNISIDFFKKKTAASPAATSGYRSTAATSGDESTAIVEGQESVAVVTGKDCKAKGALGCWLVLTERGAWNGETYPIVEVRAVKVDGVEIQPDTFYTLKGGEVVACD